MDIIKMSEDEFLCTGAREDLPTVSDTFDNLLPLLREVGTGSVLRYLGQGYQLKSLNTGLGDVCLVHDGELVGCYWGDAVSISGEHQRKGLSTPLILTAIAHRDAPTSRKVSPAGLAALSRAWNVAHGNSKNPWWP